MADKTPEMQAEELKAAIAKVDGVVAVEKTIEPTPAPIEPVVEPIVIEKIKPADVTIEDMSDEECEKAYLELEESEKAFVSKKPSKFADFVAKKRGNKGKVEEKSIPAPVDPTALVDATLSRFESRIEGILAEAKANADASEKALSQTTELLKSLGDLPAPRKTLSEEDRSEVMKSLNGVVLDTSAVVEWAEKGGISDFSRRLLLKRTLEKGGLPSLLEAQSKFGIPADVMAKIGAK